MREILFRAKRTDNGEWIEGYVVEYPSGKMEIHKKSIEPPDILLVCEVIPETIGQYTGHKDDTGRSIFEGDIVNFTDGTSTESGFWETCCCGKVGYDKEEACFYVTNRLSAESWEVLGECHIIGNIFDNQELTV